MKLTQKKMIAIALSSLLVTAAGGAIAYGGSHDYRGDRDHCDMSAPMTRDPFARLENLSDEQKDQLKLIRRESRDAMNQVRDEMRDVKSALRDAMEDQTDMEKIRSLAKQQGDQVAKLIVLRAETRGKIRNILTEEQQAQFDTLRNPAQWAGASRDDFRNPHDRMRF